MTSNTTRLSQLVRAPRAEVYRALLDARAVATWMVPSGMTSHVHRFEAREGGAFRISLTYDAPTGTGKTTAHTDTYHGRFVRLVPDEQVVEVLEFETADPAMRGEMTITFTLASVPGGTQVHASHEHLPPGLSPADNELGWRMSLEKLAALVEGTLPAHDPGASQPTGSPGYDAVIFDMDGLIVDSEPIYQLIWQRTAAELGYELADEQYMQLIGRSNEEGEALLRELLGPSFPLAEFRRLWPERWVRHVRDSGGLPLKPGLAELLDFLEARGIARAIATSNDPDKIEISLGELAGRFPILVTVSEVERGKPAPDLFLRAAERLGRAQARCVVLEDSEAGVRAGAAAGMRTIMVPDLQQPSDEVRALAHHVCASLVEAHHLLAELLEGESGTMRG